MLLMFILVVDFGLFVWGIFVCLFWGVLVGFVCFMGVCFHFVVLFQRNLITSVSLENKDVPGTWFNDLLVKYICTYCTDK